MLCVKCEEKPIRYQHAKMCYGCWQGTNSLDNLDSLKVYPCEGGCGRRIHNLPKIIIPGIPQGHGAGRAWCHGCAEKRAPDLGEQRRRKDKGPCRRCERPMRAGKKTPGFVRHHGKGLCASCYNYSIYGHSAKPHKGTGHRVLDVDKVAQIKKRLLAGETQKGVGLAFGVHKSTIYHINAGHAWGYVEPAV